MDNKNCYSCDSCNYCNSCNSCYSSYYCYSCYYCYYCYSCYSCYSCDYCYYCYSCYSCDYCNYCDSCDSCDSCDYCYYCYSCKGLRMSEGMIFCLGDGRCESSGEGYQKNHRVFNKDVSEDEYGKIKKTLDIKIKVTEWIKQDDGGHLKTYSYIEAWKNWLKESTDEQRQAILNIKQFDEKIFKEITGLTKKDLEGNSGRKNKLIAKANELKEKADQLLKEAKNM